MNHAHEVTRLFDAKAESWNSKYEPSGSLAFRVTAFSALLARQAKPEAAILDFGGGTGSIASALALQGYEMTVCDLSKQMIAAGKQIHGDQLIQWHLLPEDWKRLPFQDNAFDAVIASSVFEYLNEPNRVLAECHRILRRTGKLIFSVPNPAHFSRQWERYFRPVADLALRFALVRTLPIVGNYLSYLHVSRARYSAEHWREKASIAGLRQANVGCEDTRFSADHAMMYLVFDR